MAINFAEKYSAKVDERFTNASVTQAAFNQDYDWDGVNTINVYSIATAPMGDYTMAGNSRYGVPDELGDTTQAMTLTQDRAFTFTIDRRNYDDTMMTKESGKSLRRQMDEVVIPEVDIYRISKLVAGAGTTSAPEVITEANAYSKFLDAVTTLLNNKAPLSGTFAFISTNFYKAIRLDGSFIKKGDIAQEMLVNGQVGMVESVPLIYVPTTYLPVGVEFVVSNRMAAVSAQKLNTYRVHEDPPGINGWLAEGRIYHDAFVLNNKASAIYVHKSA